MPISCEYPVESRREQTLLHIVGHCEYLNCVPLKKFLNLAVSEVSRSEIVLEMSGCLSIDSTGMGLIAKAALALNQAPGRSLVLANLRKGPRNAITRLGLGHIVQIREIPEYAHRAASGVAPEPLRPAAADRRTIREAHEVLAEVSPGNRGLFADVVSFIMKASAAKATA